LDCEYLKVKYEIVTQQGWHLMVIMAG